MWGREVQVQKVLAARVVRQEYSGAVGNDVLEVHAGNLFECVIDHAPRLRGVDELKFRRLFRIELRGHHHHVGKQGLDRLLLIVASGVRGQS
ncbi:hypothetical protein D3C71_2023770 [compost metagenome]